MADATAAAEELAVPAVQDQLTIAPRACLGEGVAPKHSARGYPSTMLCMVLSPSKLGEEFSAG
jgi:hypothetical protein